TSCGRSSAPGLRLRCSTLQDAASAAATRGRLRSSGRATSRGWPASAAGAKCSCPSRSGYGMWGARRTPALLLAVILAALPRVAGAPERPSDVDNLQETQKAGVRQVAPALTADEPTPEEAAEARVADLVPEEYRRVVVETA